ncbi:MAG: sugar transferase [Myxococcota bacterium]
MALHPLYAPLKRGMDIAGALFIGAVGWPLIVGSACAVRWSMGGPVLFTQHRAGRHGQPFVIYKLRTMRDAVDAQGRPLPDAERITSVGRLLRKTSLDELPQLLNILRGDMSLVGPRPLPVRYLDRYSKEQARRHEVRPGLTGWAQVQGRSSVPWSDKFCYDVWYVEHVSLLTDLQILALTVAKVIKGSDTFGVGNEEFWGTQAPPQS